MLIDAQTVSEKVASHDKYYPFRTDTIQDCLAVMRQEAPNNTMLEAANATFEKEIDRLCRVMFDKGSVQATLKDIVAYTLRRSYLVEDAGVLQTTERDILICIKEAFEE